MVWMRWIVRPAGRAFSFEEAFRPRPVVPTVSVMCFPSLCGHAGWGPGHPLV